MHARVAEILRFSPRLPFSQLPKIQLPQIKLKHLFPRSWRLMEACDEWLETWVKVMWNIFQGQSEPKQVHSRVQLPQHAFLGYKRLRIVENGWKYIKSSTPLTNDYVWVITTTFSCSFLWPRSQPRRIPGRGSLKVGCVLCITYKHTNCRERVV